MCIRVIQWLSIEECFQSFRCRKTGMNELTTTSPGAKVSVFAADIGILTQSEYKVMVPAVEKSSR